MYIVLVSDRIGDKTVNLVYGRYDNINHAQSAARIAMKEGYIDVSIELTK